MKKIACFIMAAVLAVGLKFSAKAEAPGKGAVYLPILMYHQILEKDNMLGTYVISPKEFENDLKLLKKHGYTAITISELDCWLKLGAPLPAKPVMLTFDDGFESDYAYAFPLLKKYDTKAVFSVIGKYTDDYSKDVPKRLDYSHLSWEQVKEMSGSGLCEFYSHSYDMHDMSAKIGALKRGGEDKEMYRVRLYKDLDKLEARFSEEGIDNGVLCFTCPFGAVNGDLREALKAKGYGFVLTCSSGVNRLTGEPDELFRLGRYLRAHDTDVRTMMAKWENTIAKLMAKDSTR